MSDPSPALLDRLWQPSYFKYYLIGGGALLAVLLLYLFLAGPGRDIKPKDSDKPELVADDPLGLARELLAKSTDLAGCRDALQQINRHVGQSPGRGAVPLSEAEQRYAAQLPESERQTIWQEVFRRSAKDLPEVEAQALAGAGAAGQAKLRQAAERDSLQPADSEALKAELGVDPRQLAPVYRLALRSALLKKHFQLDDAEQAEVHSSAFTLLDGQHLELCFLLRDAADSLAVEAPGVKEPAYPVDLAWHESWPPGLDGVALRQATAAFAWAVRQVPVFEAGEPAEGLLPPQYALRRSSGSVLERAAVFLGLLDQLGVPGCLLAQPGSTPEKPVPWACGVVVGRDIYLFDPRLGLPLPGPDGKAIATLAAARAKPEVLAQLTADESHRYDVSAEQARKAEVYLACPLSALAPRMRYVEAVLQDQELKGPIVKVRLGQDPAQLLARLNEALAAAGSGERPQVRAWTGLTRAARQFLPSAEGGVGDPKREDLFKFGLMPARALPPELGKMEGSIRLRLLERFSQPFIGFYTAPGAPRDLALRGRFGDASTELTGSRSELLKARDRLRANPQVGKLVLEWYGKYAEAFGRMRQAERGGVADKEAAEAQMEEVLKEGQPLLAVWLDGHAAPYRLADTTYLLALCKHEQAERLQAPLDEARRAGQPVPDEAARAARTAWGDAAEWWDTLMQEFRSSAAAGAARRHAARCRLMLGERQPGADLLRDLSGTLPEPEQTARLLLAKQAEKQ